MSAPPIKAELLVTEAMPVGALAPNRVTEPAGTLPLAPTLLAVTGTSTVPGFAPAGMVAATWVVKKTAPGPWVHTTVPALLPLGPGMTLPGEPVKVTVPVANAAGPRVTPYRSP